MSPPPYAQALSPSKIAEVRAMYYGKVSLVDHWVGQILRVLDDRGLAENTLVVFWSDHGEMAGDHLRLHKQVFYESSLRVPLIMRWPGHIEPGHLCSALASTVDLAPTILQAAGVQPDPNAMGTSLWPNLRDPEFPGRDAVFSEISPGPLGNIMIRTHQWKYAIGNDGRPYMLFDLQADPNEQVNLVGSPDHTALEQQMCDRLLQFLAGAQRMMPREA